MSFPQHDYDPFRPVAAGAAPAAAPEKTPTTAEKRPARKNGRRRGRVKPEPTQTPPVNDELAAALAELDGKDAGDDVTG